MDPMKTNETSQPHKLTVSRLLSRRLLAFFLSFAVLICCLPIGQASVFAAHLPDNKASRISSSGPSPSSSSSSSTSEEVPHIAAAHAFAMDYATGRILLNQRGDRPAGIASMTKVITLYLVYKAIDQGKISWSTKVPISSYSSRISTNWLTTTVPMKKKSYTVRDLVTAAFVKSANSAAISLAEKIAGSEPRFVDMMRKQVRQWGITDAKLYNSSGLNNSFLDKNIYPGSSKKAENMMSARDIALAVWHFIHDYPQVLSMTSKAHATFDGMPLTSTDHMLPGLNSAYPGLDGFKTGTTEIAGACFAATAVRHGMRVITVIQHASHADGNEEARFQAMKKLLDYCFTAYGLVVVVRKGKSFKGSSLPLVDGKKKSVPLVAQSDLTVCLSQKEKALLASATEPSASSFANTAIPVIHTLFTEVKAPVKKGKVLATLAVTQRKDFTGVVALPSANLSAGQTVDRKPQESQDPGWKRWLDSLWKKISSRMSSWWESATSWLHQTWQSFLSSIQQWWDGISS